MRWSNSRDETLAGLSVVFPSWLSGPTAAGVGRILSAGSRGCSDGRVAGHGRKVVALLAPQDGYRMADSRR